MCTVYCIQLALVHFIISANSFRVHCFCKLLCTHTLSLPWSHTHTPIDTPNSPLSHIYIYLSLASGATEVLNIYHIYLHTTSIITSIYHCSVGIIRACLLRPFHCFHNSLIGIIVAFTAYAQDA